MQIIEWPRFLEGTLPLKENPSAITVGVFDGVHRGHRALIEHVVSHKECAVPAAVPIVITFIQSHHKKARSDRKYPGDIVSFRQKMAIFESLGVSLTIAIDFSESFRRMGGQEFLRILGEHCNMGFMAVGSNFRCGYQLDTDAQMIQEFNARWGIPTCIVQPLTEGSEPISSSQIRTAISQGKLSEAAAMLGRPFTVDLGDAAVSPADAGGFAYNIAGQGRILPPPGRYAALLLGKNSDRNAGKAADVQVAGGSIVIGPVSPPGTSWEYLEFC